MKVYVSPHVYMFMTFHTGFMFFATSLLLYFKNKHVIMNRHGSHNIRNGTVCAQTGHSTGTCTATLCVIEL